MLRHPKKPKLNVVNHEIGQNTQNLFTGVKAPHILTFYTKSISAVTVSFFYEQLTSDAFYRPPLFCIVEVKEDLVAKSFAIHPEDEKNETFFHFS